MNCGTGWGNNVLSQLHCTVANGLQGPNRIALAEGLV
jgi:hypothetical protein